ncbi:MAG: elongation factor G [Elusimicrobia bacterium]|nr:elongation factor G [Elusimicrobiota bacterium]
MADAMTTGNIRNFCLVGRNGAGKTSLAEALLYASGATNRLGKVEEGNTVCDYNEDEIERRMTISMAVAAMLHKGRKLNMIDTPGYADFVGEVLSAVAVSDAAVLVVAADGEIDAGVDEVWEMLASGGKPAAVFANKMDRANVHFDEMVAGIEARLDVKLSPIVIPGDTPEESIDLLSLKKLRVSGNRCAAEPLGTLDGKAAKYREKLMDSIASCDDALLEKYLEGGTIPEAELLGAARKSFHAGSIVPLFCGAATAMAGVHPLLDFIGDYLPAPGPLAQGPGAQAADGKDGGMFSGIVFKTLSEPGMGQMNFVKVCSGKLAPGTDVYNSTRQQRERVGQLCQVQGKKRSDITALVPGDIGVLVKLKATKTNDILIDSRLGRDMERAPKPIPFPETLVDMAVYAKSKGEEEKVSNALSTLVMEDPTIRYQYNGEIKEMVISGQGNLQLDILSARMKSRYGVAVELKPPRIPYKETCKGKAEGQGKFKRQTGGRGQYGDCWLKIQPLERGKGFEFVDDVFGGAIPKNFIPAVEKGVVATMADGVVAGYPVVDVRVTVFDGSYHEVDSSEMAFKIAGSFAFKKVFVDARPIILEPIMNLEVTVPDDYVGAVMGDLNSRRGRVAGIDRVKKRQVVKAVVPLGEMSMYSADLRSMSKGSGKFRMQYSHYEELPAHVAKGLIDAHLKTKQPED